jgi:hypothetical protein
MGDPPGAELRLQNLTKKFELSRARQWTRVANTAIQLLMREAVFRRARGGF